MKLHKFKFSSAVKQNITGIGNFVTSNNIRQGKSIKTSIPVNYIVTNRGKARKIPRTTPFIVEHFREKCRTDFSRRVVALHHCGSYFGKRLLQAIQFLVNDISRSGDFRNRLGGLTVRRSMKIGKGEKLTRTSDISGKGWGI